MSVIRKCNQKLVIIRLSLKVKTQFNKGGSVTYDLQLIKYHKWIKSRAGLIFAPRLFVKINPARNLIPLEKSVYLQINF